MSKLQSDFTNGNDR